MMIHCIYMVLLCSQTHQRGLKLVAEDAIIAMVRQGRGGIGLDYLRIKKSHSSFSNIHFRVYFFHLSVVQGSRGDVSMSVEDTGTFCLI